MHIETLACRPELRPPDVFDIEGLGLFQVGERCLVASRFGVSKGFSLANFGPVWRPTRGFMRHPGMAVKLF